MYINDNSIVLCFAKVSTKRRNSHVIPEEGIHECQEVGTCMYVDNDTYGNCKKIAMTEKNYVVLCSLKGLT